MTTDPATQSRNVLSRVLVASGFVFIAIGIFLGLWLEGVYFLIALVGLIDFVLAWAFQSGRLGGEGVGTQPVPATEQPETGPDVVAAQASEDPSYNPEGSENPYARED